MFDNVLIPLRTEKIRAQQAINSKKFRELNPNHQKSYNAKSRALKQAELGEMTCELCNKTFMAINLKAHERSQKHQKKLDPNLVIGKVAAKYANKCNGIVLVKPEKDPSQYTYCYLCNKKILKTSLMSHFRSNIHTKKSEEMNKDGFWSYDYELKSDQIKLI